MDSLRGMVGVSVFSCSLISCGAMKNKRSMPMVGTAPATRNRFVYPRGSTSHEHRAGPRSIPRPRKVRYLPMASPCLCCGAASLTVLMAV